jgi:hypothetical protein
MLLTCFFNSINKKKKTCDSYMLKERMSFFHVSCKKFLVNQFIRNFCRFPINAQRFSKERPEL